ncbi:hypothetical protein [Burkholderia lata]|uniref:Uncharacterized protein n=1 Tax=Burkholderia lata (strain ATCC 17760 / DSM 23089 / LMG 22485 / NCIMB 9086 / R18194 / 383) TaxID=482957 RepID=Q39LT0_BURL3|nr:hypothetical protein [Burkholderia lata]ABB06586.1 hypothetical protein Bcep18194_C7542 [Burkholderia lata]
MSLDGYYINLDRSVARRIRIEKQIHALGLESMIRRFAAVDGGTAGPFDAALKNRTWACRQSHEKIIDGGDAKSTTIILEDDIEISQAFSDIVTDEVMRKFTDDEPTVDIVFLECGFQWRFLPLLLAKADSRMTWRLSPSGNDDSGGYNLSTVDLLDAKGIYSWSSAAYIVTPVGKQTLRRLFSAQRDQPGVSIDVLYKRWIDAGELKGKICIPFLATPHSETSSTIDHAPSELLDPVPTEWVSLFRRFLFAGDHGFDLTELEAKMERYSAPLETSPEYRLGMLAYERFRASVRPDL